MVKGEYKATGELIRIAVNADGLVRTKPEGVYLLVPPVLNDGDQHRLTLTADGRLRVEGGAVPAHVLATTGPHTGALPLIDLEVGVQGEVIIRGAVDWEALAVGVAGQVLTSGGAGANPTWAAAAGGATFCNVQVYDDGVDGPAPPAWTDLDLSGTVGANRALVYLKVEFVDAGASTAIVFRENGEALAVDVNPDYKGVTHATSTNPYIEYVWVLTDAAGIVEWMADGANDDVDVYLRAYIV